MNPIGTLLLYYIKKMNTRCDNPLVIDTFKTLNGLVSFGTIYRDTFIPISNISIDDRGHLFYLDNANQQHSVSSLIMRLKGLQTARWLNHLYFIDSFGNVIKFKNHLSERHNLSFT